MRKIIYVDMDGVLVDFESGIKSLSVEEIKIYENKLDEVPGIFSKMKPIEGAIENFKIINSHFEVYILTSAPWENPTALNDKLAWIKMYLGDLAKKRVIFSHNKHLNIGDYLIDDRKANGSSDFRGEHIHFGTKEFPDWAAVLKYLNIS
jgi:5'(3')-deoxyribonucleotidase